MRGTSYILHTCEADEVHGFGSQGQRHVAVTIRQWQLWKHYDSCTLHTHSQMITNISSRTSRIILRCRKWNTLYVWNTFHMASFGMISIFRREFPCSPKLNGKHFVTLTARNTNKSTQYICYALTQWKRLNSKHVQWSISITSTHLPTCRLTKGHVFAVPCLKPFAIPRNIESKSKRIIWRTNTWDCTFKLPLTGW